MNPILHLISNVFAAGTQGRVIAIRIIRWLGGLSLSSILFLLIAFVTTVILRKKGYGVRLGLACLVLYARPGSRRFPDGCEVRISTRIIGFLFGGGRGPWLDVYAERFYMRLRPTLVNSSVFSSPGGMVASLPPSVRRLLRFIRVNVYYVGVAVEHGYWATLVRNIVTRVVAFIVRGLRVRVEKVRIWKDGGSWEYKAEQFVLAGRAAGVFGSRYSLSVNELYVNVCKAPLSDSPLFEPIHASLVLRRGVEITAYLTPRFFTLLRPRKMAIMDDLRISVNVRDVSCTAPRILNANVSKIAIELCPGYSRGLRAKLPPSAPTTKRPRRPGILRYWEGSGSITGFSFRLTAPTVLARLGEEGAGNGNMSLPASVADSSASELGSLKSMRGSENGVFIRVESVKVDAYGKAADERHEAMTRASVNIRGCSAGSIAVDALSHALYESMSTSNADAARGNKGNLREGQEPVESVENTDKIVAARPEALVWLEDITGAVDINCSKRHSMRVDVGGSGGILAIEPVGLVMLVQELRYFTSRYIQPRPRRTRSSSSLETESLASLARSSSGSSLQSLDDEPFTIRFVSDFRHLTFMALGHGPVGDGDTMAVVVSSRTMVIPQIDLVGGALTRIVGSATDFSLMHWSQWARTTNMRCKEAKFDVQKGPEDKKRITLGEASFDWDMDMQSGLESLPHVFSALKKLKPTNRPSISSEFEGEESTLVMPQALTRGEMERGQFSESERRDRRERRQRKLLKSLDTWEISGTKMSVTASFPDGPRMGLFVGELPRCRLGAKEFVGRNVVLSMQDKKCAYAAEFKMGSPIHTMNRNLEKRVMNIEAQGLRVLLYHDFQFGYLLQDWLLRIRSVIRISRESKLKRRGIPVQKPKRRPFPDVNFTAADVEFYVEEHPLSGFLARMLPLFQDETRERLVREQLMAVRIQQLDRIARAEIAGTAGRCVDALNEKDSEIWVRRTKHLRRAVPPVKIANGYLPQLESAPVSTLVAASLSFTITMDDLVREHGSKESIRRLKMLDDYELGFKKYNKTRQHESDAWNSIGFRAVGFEAVGVRLRFRDYNVAFAVIDRMYFVDTTVGQAVQATKPPYISETSVAIGRRRLAKVVKGMGPTKTYADIHLVIETLQCDYNPAFLNSIGDFSRGISRFFGGGKNPSPRIPWFDTLRVNMHGRMRITAKKLKGRLSSSISPHSKTKHYVDIEADNFAMLASRLEATEDDPFPVCWKLYNWHIRPSNFDKDRKSEMVFDLVRVGMKTTTTVLSGDPQDHYFIPFPSKEEIAQGGPGIGSGSCDLIFVKEPVEENDNGFGNYTTWMTGLHDIPNHDSFAGFKTHTMILGIDVSVQHAETPRTVSHNVGSSVQFQRYTQDGIPSPSRPSILHSDAISTLIKVVKKLISRPLSCKWSPRRVVKSRKPPSKTSLSSTLIGLDLVVDARNLNVVFHNNLEPGHSLFVSVKSLVGELWKRTDIERIPEKGIRRTSRLIRRTFDINDIYTSICVPGLDLAVDADDTGKLLTVDSISLSDDYRDELSYMGSPLSGGAMGPSSGFGNEDLDESPFYTFSATHPLQRGNKLDKVLYDQCLLVDKVRLIWSPVRRTSVFAWPDAFKEKTFCMKAPKIDLSERTGEAFGNASGMRTPEQDSEQKGRTLPAARTKREKEDALIADLLDDSDEQMSDLDIGEPKRSASIPDHLTSMDAADFSRPSMATFSQESTKAHRADVDLLSIKSLTDSGTVHPDPLSPPLMSFSRTKSSNPRRPAGSMVDLLGPVQSRNQSADNAQSDDAGGRSCRVVEVLKTTPKYVLFINDCQVAFGSPQTSGIVFLTSRAVRAGILDKELQKNLQLGEANESWTDREYRVHLNAANLYTRCRSHGEFDFSSESWVPEGNRRPLSLALITRNPVSMDLMYISSSNTAKEGEEYDHILRPSLLFINVPDICLSTNADEFHAATDVVRKVLMQSMRSSELVNDELAYLRYKLQLAGGKVSSEELDDIMRRLNNITKQFLYAGDTFQQKLVDALMLPEEASFSDTLLRYKAKARAVATFMRQDQRASSTDVLYPTMYVSYSFDKCSWELRETSREMNKDVEHPFVEITLDHLVCRHIFYVGRGSSAEVTFANISAENKIKSSYFQGILQPATTGTNLGADGGGRKKSRIKASDGAPVAFRWYSTQEDRVGGIPVYDLLTIQVAPMTASVTRKLYGSVSNFIFSTRAREAEDTSGITTSKSNSSISQSRNGLSSSQAGSSSDSKMSSLNDANGSGRKVVGMQSSSSAGLRTSIDAAKMDDVSQMARRGETSMLFKYVFIDAFELTASYKNKETSARSVLDVMDLFVTTPSFSYSNQVWTWKDFSTQIRKDLVMTFARRGVSNLAKIKLLPGYSGWRKRFVQSADALRESIYSRLPPAAGASETSQEQELGDEEAAELREELGEDADAFARDLNEEDNSSEMEGEGIDKAAAIDAAVADISVAEGRKRDTILRALYGSKSMGVTEGGLKSMSRYGGASRSMPASESSGESGRRGLRPPIPPYRRAGSTPSRGSVEDDRVLEAPRASLFKRIRRKAKEVKMELKAEMEDW